VPSRLKPMLKTKAHHLNVVSDTDGPGTLGFDAVYTQFFRYVAAITLRLLGDDTDVDDVVQEVFWDCSRKIHKLNDMEHARRWLIQVTVRKTRKRLRRRKVSTMLNLSLGRPLEPSMPSASADDRAAVIQLFRLLEKVPVNHRLAWSLRYIEGASLQEVAESCGCSLASAKRWVASTQTAITGGDDE
jgi:RNA polymerase sigma-70 factor (ECF subfamily)